MKSKAAFLRKSNTGEWHYRPPLKAVRNGIVSPWSETSGQKAYARAVQDNKRIKAWRRGEIAGVELDDKSNLAMVAAHYQTTAHYKSLSKSSQSSYSYMFRKVAKSFGDTSVPKINVPQCQRVYDEWVEESLPNSKMLVRALGILMGHAMSLSIIQSNPMNLVKKVAYKPETTIWTKEQVQKFVDTAMSKWEWRNIGLMALLCYEYGQRPIDIARLTWDNVDFDKNQITIKQSKRGATVYVPIDEQVKGLLLNQYQDFKFQHLVLPHLRSIDGALRPYTNNQFASLAADIIKEAGLPEDLKIGKLRNTAITEMVEAGVDSTGIMQVSGHANIQSINPYLKNTLKGATTALGKRKESKA